MSLISNVVRLFLNCLGSNNSLILSCQFTLGPPEGVLEEKKSFGFFQTGKILNMRHLHNLAPKSFSCFFDLIQNSWTSILLMKKGHIDRNPLLNWHFFCLILWSLLGLALSLCQFLLKSQIFKNCCKIVRCWRNYTKLIFVYPRIKKKK